MWANITEEIKDGILDLSSGDSPQALVVGYSNTSSSEIQPFSRQSDVKKLFGNGPLSDHLTILQEYMKENSVLAMRTEGDIKGKTTLISSSGSAEITYDGDPLYDMLITITKKEEGFSVQIKHKQEYTFISENLEEDFFGINVTVGEDSEIGDWWKLKTTRPKSSLKALEQAIDKALEIYDINFIVIAQDSSVEEVSFWGRKSDNLFEEHKPAIFLLETTFDQEEDFTSAINQKIIDFKDISSRFVSVVAQAAYISTNQGKIWGSVLPACLGTLINSSVSKSIGATRDYVVQGISFPRNWTNLQSKTLDEARFITLRSYSGLKGLFWSNGITMADRTSDYRFLETVRTVFKAIKLARTASLPYIHAPASIIGIQNLVSAIRHSLSQMSSAHPKELTSFSVNVPAGQNFVNNGVLTEISLYGVPIIRKIVLNFGYKYEE
ncbi:Protein of unknown function [Brevinema andersonii]|uniref:Phage tail sheath protein n=1 Tax=Brevinema andersonii TaxID=34097 RepID=A0A1I1DS99_BREAD|nr:DUF2586 family protein [Brevinema andersonii]SFB75433.1 Protein of unknown function [Brevinema andersonii]